MNCAKCGAELHPEQKVCLECGARTAAGGAFYVEEKQLWRPTPAMIKVTGAAAFVLILVLLALGLRVTPPESVANEWFDALTQRQVRKASSMITPALQQTLSARGEDIRSLSDEYYSAVINDGATWTMGEPRLDPEDRPVNATITFVLTYPDGQRKEVEARMLKIGRRWLVNEVS